MTPPDELRILVEAAFPGATIEADPEFGDWLITPPAPLRIGGAEIETIGMSYAGEISGCTLAATAETIGSAWPSRRIRQALRDMLQDVSAHDLIAARRRLGL